ncbi:hypothetical protein CDL12_21411 [Handroanthus impetiginosus]|uniref:Uncharacterized protein n=1 Tax=Handroanthus impetiginosus TaxID=429701 RepID=A0A2G9GL51_9LAMI|nr:hypothetical protein CDL12_21411 [Handroanthus impetiginosus]
MAGTVYLRTNRFEVKLEGITFKTKEFESLCKMNFLFPDSKVWARPPIVGLDVMRHPRDPSILLLLLCFGIGCVILKFGEGEALPAPIHRFFADKRVQFVGFGIPEKKDLFPFEELGLKSNNVDIGYLAAKVFKDPKYKRCELAELARKVLGIKRMIGLTEASSFERHEQIKCAICQLFITSLIAMGLLGANDRKKPDYFSFSRTSSFLKNLNSLHLLAEGWFKLPKISKKKKEEEQDKIRVRKMEDGFGDDVIANVDYRDSPFGDCFVNAETPVDDSEDYSVRAEVKEVVCSNHDSRDSTTNDKNKESESVDCSKDSTKKPIKGILKCPSTTLQRCDSSPLKPETPPSPSTPSDRTAAAARGILKRANSKGYNVSFKFH